MGEQLRRLLRTIEGKKMADRGWCPFARQHRGRGEGPFGYPAGKRDQNRPLMFTDHRMGGSKSTLDNDAWRHENWVGVTFGVGRDGSLDQYTSIFDAHWGNGVGRPVSRYDRANPRLAHLETLGRWIVVNMGTYTTNALVSPQGVNIPNSHSISFEHEDKAIDQPWTLAMLETTIRAKKWCLEELEKFGLPMRFDANALTGHFQFDATDRAGCPGKHWPKAEIIAALTEEDDMTFFAWADNRLWFVGPGGAHWVTTDAAANEIAKQYGLPNGKPTVAMSKEAIAGLGGR